MYSQKITKLLLLAAFNFANAESITVMFKEKKTEIHQLDQSNNKTEKITSTIFNQTIVKETFSDFVFKNEASRKILSKVLKKYDLNLEGFSEKFDEYKSKSGWFKHETKNNSWKDITSNFNFYYDSSNPEPEKKLSFNKVFDIIIPFFYEKRKFDEVKELNIKGTYKILHKQYHDDDILFGELEGETYLIVQPDHACNILIGLDSNSDIEVEIVRSV